MNLNKDYNKTRGVVHYIEAGTYLLRCCLVVRSIRYRNERFDKKIVEISLPLPIDRVVEKKIGQNCLLLHEAIYDYYLNALKLYC